MEKMQQAMLHALEEALQVVAGLRDSVTGGSVMWRCLSCTADAAFCLGDGAGSVGVLWCAGATLRDTHAANRTLMP